MMKRIPFLLLAVQIVVLAIFTFIEKEKGQSFASVSLYGSPWFLALWFAILVTALFVIFKEKMYRIRSSLLLHFSFVFILAGAATTHFWGEKGFLHLRKGEVVDQIVFEGQKQICKIPFSLELKNFDVVKYPGTEAPSDYRSLVIIKDENNQYEASISMNKILKRDGYRFYQTSFDADLQGSILTVTYDPYGILITYIGYLTLLAAMILVLCDKKSYFRKWLKNPLWKTFLLVPFIFCFHSTKAADIPAFSDETAKQFGDLYILHQDRIMTIESFAVDFTKKLTGKPYYKDYAPVQVLSGWIFAPQKWQYEPMIKVKEEKIRELLNVPNMAKFIDFFDADKHYKIDLLRNKITSGNLNDKEIRDLSVIDEKIQLIAMVQSGILMKIFPIEENGHSYLVAPAEMNRYSLQKEDSLLMRSFFPLLYESFINGEATNSYISKFHIYQQQKLGDATPSKLRTEAEHLYNYCNLLPMLSYLTLTTGILAFIILCCALIRNKPFKYQLFFRVLLYASWLCLTFLLILRSIISERLPFSNGYETLLFTAWLSQTFTLLISKRFTIILPLGILVSGFSMLTANISNMNPQITTLMPVLNSPILSIHVSLMMISYAIMGFIALISLLSLIVYFIKENKLSIIRLSLLNRLLLYPGEFCMIAGIFVGAVWANISWGSYWAWDPKETWALIAMLVYAFPFHFRSIPFFRKSIPFQIYTLLAFLTILMTYFGVNFYLGGMHSYAN